MIEIQLNEKSAENVKAIQELRTMGFSDGQIQEWLNNSQKSTRQEKQKPRTNFDRITESEQAFVKWVLDNYYSVPKFFPCETKCNGDCEECFIEWLKKECEK